MDTPRLELVEITDEDAFFEEPPAQELFDVPMSGPKRPWLWCGAFAMALALAGLGGFHIGRTHEVAVAAIAAAPPLQPVTTPPVDCVERAPKPSPAPPRATTPPPATPKRTTAAHVKSAPRSAPAATTKPSDPLTL